MYKLSLNISNISPRLKILKISGTLRMWLTPTLIACMWLARHKWAL